MKYLIYFLFLNCLFHGNYCFGQENKTDSLLVALKNTKEDTVKINILNNIIYLCYPGKITTDAGNIVIKINVCFYIGHPGCFGHCSFNFSDLVLYFFFGGYIMPVYRFHFTDRVEPGLAFTHIQHQLKIARAIIF